MPKTSEYQRLKTEGRCVGCGAPGPHIGKQGGVVARCQRCYEKKKGQNNQSGWHRIRDAKTRSIREGATVHPVPTGHVHSWRLEPPTAGELSEGRCACGATRMFDNIGHESYVLKSSKNRRR